MSLTFTQIVSTIDRNCKSNSFSYNIADKTEDINQSLDYIYATIFNCGGTWQFDDSNHTDYPIITTDLNANQRDYSFVSDENGNLILDIYKVLVMGEDGIYREITPKDQQATRVNGEVDGFVDGQNLTGTPTEYDKTANGIFLNKIPSYNSTGGLKIYINREGSYFISTDTTKMPGFAGLYHEYLALRPSYQYAYRNGLPNINVLRDEMLLLEDKIKKHYGKRERDISRRLVPNRENNR